MRKPLAVFLTLSLSALCLVSCTATASTETADTTTPPATQQQETAASPGLNPDYVENPADQPESSKKYLALSREEQNALEAESNRKVTQCLQERGWNVVMSDSTTIEFKDAITDKQLEKQQKKDMEACSQLYPHPAAGVKYTRADYEKTYDAKVAINECLAKLGLNVSTPPSKDTWVEQIIHNEANMWDPYEIFALPGAEYKNMPRNKFAEVTKQCPNY